MLILSSSGSPDQARLQLDCSDWKEMSKAFKRILKLFLESHAVAFLWISFFSPKIWFKNQKNMQDNRSLPLKLKQNKKRTVWIEQSGSFISKEWLQDWGSLQILNPDHVASFGLLTFLTELRKTPRNGASPAVTVWSLSTRTPLSSKNPRGKHPLMSARLLLWIMASLLIAVLQPHWSFLFQRFFN